MQGKLINKTQEATVFGVNERSIQRDIEDIRSFLAENTDLLGARNCVLYDRTRKGYYLEQITPLRLSNSEILALCKILLDSRAFTKKEMVELLERIIDCCAIKQERQMIHSLVLNETFHYIEPRHHTIFINHIWELGQAIQRSHYIEISYIRTKDRAIVQRRLKPAAIMFSEYYFYLTAFIDDPKVRENFEVEDDLFPTIYRLDRIQNIKICDETFFVPYAKRFEEGEFRKRIQFMYGGKLQTVKFTYSGSDIDAILDRLPTAVILSEEDGVYTISAEVFGKGIDMWLRSQGDYVKRIQ